MKTDSAKLEWLELGRGLAAFSVLACHIPSDLANVPAAMAPIGTWGTWGVAFFFVLSGFIIFHIHSDDVDNPERVASFLQKRIIRIFPTYFLIFFGSLLVAKLVIVREHAPAITMSMLADNVFLLPGAQLFIPAAWTLRHECLFYGLFAMLIVSRRIGTAVFAAWITCIIAAQFFDVASAEQYRPIWDLMLGYLNLYFICGMALAACMKVGRLRLAVLFTAPLFVLTLLLYAVNILPIALVQLTFCTAFVAIAADLSEHGLCAPAGSPWMGAVSYPLYLVHLKVMWLVRGVFRQTGYHLPANWFLESIIAILLSLTAAYAIVVLFERPLLPKLKRLASSRANAFESVRRAGARAKPRALNPPVPYESTPPSA